jgi:signal transduction histidine kinase
MRLAALRSAAALYTAAPATIQYVISGSLLAGIALLDYRLGSTVSFSIFYAVPISLVVWNCGLWPGIAAASLGAGCWLLADLLGQPAGDLAAVPFWNAGVRLVFFLMLVFLLSRNRELTRNLMRMVDEKTGQWIAEMSERQAVEAEMLEAKNRVQREIAHELHDGLGQFLTGVAFKAKDLANQLEEGRSELADPAERLVELVNEGIAEANRLARGLNPVDAGTGNLVMALQRLAHEIEDGCRIRCRLETDRPVIDVDEDAALHLFRIAQESLNNAIKHARASELKIILSRGPETLELVVSDNGCGFEPESGSGMGMRTLRYRTTRLRGSLIIESAPGRGTVVRCAIPV